MSQKDNHDTIEDPSVICTVPEIYSEFDGDVIAQIPISCEDTIPCDASKLPVSCLDQIYDRGVTVYGPSKEYKKYGVEINTPTRIDDIVDTFINRDGCEYGVIKKALEHEDPSMDTQFDRTKVKKEINNCIAKILCLKSAYSLRDEYLEDIIVNILEKMENEEEILM